MRFLVYIFLLFSLVGFSQKLTQKIFNKYQVDSVAFYPPDFEKNVDLLDLPFNDSITKNISTWPQDNPGCPPPYTKKRHTWNVEMTFVVNEDGKISDPKITYSSTCPSWDVRVLQNLRTTNYKWKPAVKNGKYVKSYVEYVFRTVSACTAP